MGTRSLEPPLGDAERPGRIEKAVEKEIRRRKRLLLAYGILLIVPVVVASVYLKTGVTQQQWVDRDVKPIRQTLSEIEPALGQVRAADARLSEQQARLDSLQEKQSAMLQTVQPVADKVEQLNQRLAEISSNQRDVLANVQQSTSSVAAQQMQFREELTTIARGQDQIRERQASLERDVQSLSEHLSAVPPTSFDQRLREQNEIIRQLQVEVRRLQQNQPRPR